VQFGHRLHYRSTIFHSLLLQPPTDMEAFPRTTTNAYDHLLKILLVGDTSSNKSTLLRAYLDDSDEDQRGTTTLGE
jgi:hypothetical protein